MLTMLIAALARSASFEASHTLSTTIHAWSTARFEVSVNGDRTLRLRGKGRIALDPYLRPGANTIDVRYRTDDGKISFHQPATLTIESRSGGRRTTELRIVASIDNPRGRRQIVLVRDR